MDCFGIGTTRLLAASVEVLSSVDKVRWPLLLAPYQICIIPQTVDAFCHVMPCGVCCMHRCPFHRGSGKNAPVHAPVPVEKPGQKYHFAAATILTLLSCTKMVKIAAIASVFACKNFPRPSSEIFPRLLVGQETPSHPPPLLIHGVCQSGTSTQHSTRCPGTHYLKWVPMGVC